MIRSRRMIDREWPPPPEPVQQLPKIMIEVVLAVVVFVLSPLASWCWAAWPGGYHPWAAIVWPAGWALAVVVLLVGNCIRARRLR